MSVLLSTLCPNGVKYQTISNLLHANYLYTITPSFKLKRQDYKTTGQTPIISQEEEYISGYCNNSDDNIPLREYVCFGDHSEHIKYIDFAFVQGADGLKITHTNAQYLSARYLYHALSACYHRHNNYERHWKYVCETSIPVPPMQVQQYLVEILDKFDALAHDIEIGLPAEIAMRRKQYEYYREKLLTFKKAS